MHLLRTGILLVMLLISTGCWRHTEETATGSIQQLELVQAFAVDTPGPLEPSGLVMWDGGLYTVADKDDNTVYRVLLNGDRCKLEPFLDFQPPPGYMLDWEGITVDDKGTFYLVSETLSRIARVDRSGNSAWVSPDLSLKGAEVGLFATSNAGLEGIAWLGTNHWLGAVEREPRGLVEFRIEGASQLINPSLHEQSPYSLVLNMVRIPDYSGLSSDNDRLFALFRNAHLVVELKRIDGSLQEINAWSYRHIETDPGMAFIEQTYGQAEGLAVDGENVYIIFDNNLGGRQSDPADRRPLFVHARMSE